MSEVGDAFGGGFWADTSVNLNGVWPETFDTSIITSADVEIGLSLVNADFDQRLSFFHHASYPSLGYRIWTCRRVKI